MTSVGTGRYTVKPTRHYFRQRPVRVKYFSFEFEVMVCPRNTKLDFGLLTISSKTILRGDFNAHSELWNYKDKNFAGLVMEDLLNSDKLELLYNESNIPTYLHYNGTGTNLDLTFASADISDVAEREVIYDPGSGHRMIVTTSPLTLKNHSGILSGTDGTLLKLIGMPLL
ncbi:hypothetical protein TNCT_660351 [Trichonephila clavata]|uniref:Endonuclease/exonuclease/phosphatase domain-containing protein n=1 Tax=Trichonephila clavata TaxID=2740835 RepID=A0A8X6FCY3_TRICU|nr:hypothetical protein TNCT_660351 [Trichonephila clavata]